MFQFFSFITIFFLSSFALAKSDSVIVIKLDPSICQVENVALEPGTIPTAASVAKDAYCAKLLMDTHAPHGAITIFGSARAKPGSETYQITEEFAFQWSKRHGKYHPILTGGGPGIMAAGNEGAARAKAPSLGIGTHFSGGQEKPNEFISAAYMASSFAQREADLVDYAAAIIAAPGGFGTEWEIFESLSKMQTNKKTPVPMILLGKKSYWQPLLDRVAFLKSLGTISPEDSDLFTVQTSASDAVSYLEKALGLNNVEKKEASHAK